MRDIQIVGRGSAGKRHEANLKALGTWESDGPPIAIIANVTSAHVPSAIAYARSGYNLFIEKPLSHNLDGIEELQQLVADKRLTTMMGFQYRFHPLLAQLRGLLLGGTLGRILSVHASWGEYLPDWHPGEDYHESYAARAELGGGVLRTLGSHVFDYLRWLFGNVCVTGAIQGRIPALTTSVADDWCDVGLLLGDDIPARVHLDFWRSPARHILIVDGDRHSCRIDFDVKDGRRCAIAMRAAGQDYATVLGEYNSPMHANGPRLDRNAPFLAEMKEFLGAVNQGRESRVPLAEGMASLRPVLHAAEMAAERIPVDG